MKDIYKKNVLFIILLGIVGFCFGLLDWDSNLVDLVYLKYNNAFIISIISANIGTARLLATLFCIKINNSSKPNFIFITCMILCSLFAIATAICFDTKLIVPFIITYLLEVLVLEIFSGYHYAYAYHSLPDEEVAMGAHSKRISVFKVLQALGIMVAGYICSKFTKNAFLMISILSTIVFIVAILFVTQVKNFPKNKEEKEESLLKKLNIFKYTKYFQKWFLIRIVGRFALSSLLVLLSLMVIDNNQSVLALKVSKSLLWIISGILFFVSSYFIKKKWIVKGDIVIKLILALLLPFVFLFPDIIFILILLYGVLEPFNTMSHLEMLREDQDCISVPQKDMVINLAGYIAKRND